MIRKYVLPAVALVGAIYAAAIVAIGSQPAPVAQPVADPARPPFESYIAGSGPAAAEATLADLKNQVALWTSVSDKRAVSEEELARKRFAAQAAEARLAEARAQLALLKAGSWKSDLELARAEVAQAGAELKAAET